MIKAGIQLHALLEPISKKEELQGVLAVSTETDFWFMVPKDLREIRWIPLKQAQNSDWIVLIDH